MWFLFRQQTRDSEGKMDMPRYSTTFFGRIGRFWRGFGAGQSAPGDLWVDSRTGWRPGGRTSTDLTVHKPTQRWLECLP